jgi:hypothetical protein
MYPIYENVQKDSQCSATTGLNLAQFEALHNVFTQHYKPKNNHIITGKQPHFFYSREALFFVLYWLKTSPTFEVLGVNFGISNFSAHRYICYILPFLKYTLAIEKQLASRVFPDEETFKKTFENVSDIFVDGTEIPIERSKDNETQRKGFSGKKKSIP